MEAMVSDTVQIRLEAAAHLSDNNTKERLVNLDKVGESDNNRVRVATSNGGHIGAAEGASIRGDGSNNLRKSGHDLEDDSRSIKL